MENYGRVAFINIPPHNLNYAIVGFLEINTLPPQAVQKMMGAMINDHKTSTFTVEVARRTRQNPVSRFHSRVAINEDQNGSHHVKVIGRSQHNSDNRQQNYQQQPRRQEYSFNHNKRQYQYVEPSFTATANNEQPRQNVDLVLKQRYEQRTVQRQERMARQHAKFVKYHSHPPEAIYDGTQVTPVPVANASSSQSARTQQTSTQQAPTKFTRNQYVKTASTSTLSNGKSPRMA